MRIGCTIFIALFAAGVSYPQWTIEVNLQGQNYFLGSITAVDSSTAWVCGNGPGIRYLVRRTFQSGWVNIPTGGLPFSLGNLVAQDSLNAWVVANRVKVYHTTNAGQNWSLQIDAANNIYGYPMNIQFSKTNKRFGYAIAISDSNNSLVKLYRTTDRGQNWNLRYLQLDSPYTYPSMTITDSIHIWLGLYCGYNCNGIAKILISSNSGINWLTGIIPTAGSDNVGAIGFNYDNLIGYADVGEYYDYLKRTTNGGFNWVQWTYLGQENVYAARILNINGTSIWYCATNERVLKSTDNGSNWFNTNAPYDSGGINGFDAIRQGNRVYGWAITYGGLIMRLTDTSSVIGINGNTSSAPQSYYLYQNYPNPFNPVTKINYEIPTSSYVIIKVFDLLGNETKTLVNKKQSSGRYEVEFDGNNLPSGVYFYRIEAVPIGRQAGSFISSKKMVLVR